ncbi:MAG: hypothetical protein JWN15_1093 [Firmicutes bacterium]|nr:hypothetical protein [Bacillota bacterium]
MWLDDEVSSDIDRWLSRLAHEDVAVRTAALRDLQKAATTGLSVANGAKLIRAAANQYPPTRFSRQDTAAQLMQAVAGQPQAEYIELVIDLFSRLNAQTQDWAIRLVAATDTPEAAHAFVSFIGEYARLGREPVFPVAIPLERNPRFGEILFPALLQYGSIEQLRHHVYTLFLQYCRHGLVAEEIRSGAAQGILDLYRSLRSEVLRLEQQPGIDWLEADDYESRRYTVAALLDLFRYLPQDVVKAELYSALAYRDHFLTFAALSSLLYLDFQVEPEHLEVVAANREYRNQLYELMGDLGKTHLFPPRFCSQAAFAEANMVSWLVYPTELGRAPDEIELMEVVSFNTDSDYGVLDYYLFRFRSTHDWAEEKGWMAGVAGPFLRKDAPATHSYGDTFSKFEPWASKSPEEHVAEIVELMENWRKHHRHE